MRMGERAGRRAIRVATSAAVAGLLMSGGGGAGVARGADRTFNVSLVGTLNPNTTGPGTTNNIYSDLWADGNLVVLGSVSAGGGGGVTILDNSNPAAPIKHSRYL